MRSESRAALRARKREKAKSRLLFVSVLIFAIFVSSIAVYYGLDMAISTVNGSSSGSSSSNKATINTSKIKDKNLYSENIVLIDADSGDILYEKNGDSRTYPASLTKIMTVLVAIEESKNLDKGTSLSHETLAKLASENASMAGYNANEDTNIKDLLYGSMLASGADASIGLAQATTGSVSGFVEKMNEKATELGMNDTNYTNVTGLHNDNHYTTAKDVSILLRYALQNPTFKEIFTTKSHQISTSKRQFTIHSTFFSEYKGRLNMETVLGAKTGTTSAAGCCLASFVSLKEHQYILVTTNAPIGGSNQPFSFDDLDYVFYSL